MNVELGFAVRSRRGETVSGDAVVIRAAGDARLVAVIDALGHGPKAADVAQKSRTFLDSVDLDIGMDRIMDGLDQALRGSRGAAATLCFFDGGRIIGSGVGNVDIRIHGDQLPAVLTPGILGAGVRKLRVFEGSVRPGTRIAIFSDGLSSRLSLYSVHKKSPQAACEKLIEDYWRTHDDAGIAIADILS